MPDETISPSIDTKPARQEAWERWVVIWHLVFYVSLAIPTILVLLTDDVNRSKLSLLGLSIGLGVWYALVMEKKHL